MANPTTLTDLQDQAKDYADMTGSSFPVPTRLTEYINKGLSRLHDMLVKTNQNYFKSTDSISVVAGTETYSLPTDYYKTIKMWYTSNSRRYKVEKFNLDEIDGLRTSPLSAGTITHWYVPQITRLAAGGDVVDTILPDGWEDYAALYAAIRLAVKQGDPNKIQSLQMLLADVTQNILSSVEPRSEEPNHLGDYHNRFTVSNNEIFRSGDHKYMYNILGDNVHIIQVTYLGA